MFKRGDLVEVPQRCFTGVPALEGEVMVRGRVENVELETKVVSVVFLTGELAGLLGWRGFGETRLLDAIDLLGELVREA